MTSNRVRKTQMNRNCFIFSAIVVVSAATVGSAQTKFAEEGGWGVYVNDATLGCFAQKTQEDGYVFQLGQAEKGQDFGFLALYANEDVGIDDNEVSRVVFTIDGTEYQGYTIGRRQGEYDGGFVYTNNPSFVEGLSQQSKLTLFPGAENEYVVDTAGIDAAINKTLECIEAQAE